MIDNIEYYMEYLDGLTKDMPEEFVKLAQVFELSVFEPVYMEGEDDIYAAYLMNDSVEQAWRCLPSYSLLQLYPLLRIARE